jgi:hypothetical protein
VHWLVWPGVTVVGLQLTLTAVTLEVPDAGETFETSPPVHPVINNTPEKNRQGSTLRSIVYPPVSESLYQRCLNGVYLAITCFRCRFGDAKAVSITFV